MTSYIVRHGEAKSGDVDPERSLTVRGREDITMMASFLARTGLTVRRIRHSGKKRAEETALILGDQLHPPAGVHLIQGLAPEDDVAAMAEVLELETEAVMLVSHLPFVEKLTGLLLTGNERNIVTSFPPGGCVALDRHENGWSLMWAVNPEML